MATTLVFSALKIEYIKSSHHKTSYDEKANKWRDGYDLLCNGYLFHRNRKNEPKNGGHYQLAMHAQGSPEM